MLLLVTTSHPSLAQHPGPGGGMHPNLGRLVQPRHTSSIERTALTGVPWAADNDCFQGLDAGAFRHMLGLIDGLPGCRFVTVPDVVGDAAATARSFAEWRPAVANTGLPVALVAQDGLERVGVPWQDVDALFIGGTDTFKLGPEAASVAREAKARGKWVHWGRVNSARRMELIAATGAADSCDGSSWARWRHTHLDRGLAHCAALDARMPLFEEARAA